MTAPASADALLFYEVIFPVGLMFAGAILFLVPVYGWKAMFVVAWCRPC
jgi:hypothetical protein